MRSLNQVVRRLLQSIPDITCFPTLRLFAISCCLGIYNCPAQAQSDLETAIETGDVESVTSILTNGADPSGQTLSETPLMLASSYGHLEIMKILIDAGADMDQMDSIGRTALTRAIDSRQPSAVELLLNNGANPNQRKVSSRHYPIARAISLNDLDIIRMLIAAGAQVNSSLSNGYTPLMFAAGNNDSELMQLLLEAGANPDSRMLSSSKPSFDSPRDVTSTLLNGGSTGSGTALGKAALLGAVETTKMLVDAGANIDARQFSGHSPLTIAAEFGHAEIVRILLEAGADRDRQRDDGMTAFLLAQRYGHDEVIRIITAF